MLSPELFWIAIPVVLIAVFTLILVKWFLNNENKRRRQEFLLSNNEAILKQKLQAFERFTLYLERISPEALVLREQRKDMNTFQLQNHLLKTIRSEFNHNMAMQIYIPFETWEKIKNAREEVARLINASAAQLPPNLPSFELGKKIIEDAGTAVNYQVRQALDSIRRDVDELGLRS